MTVTVPQLGEGLRSIRLIRFLKQVGESVREEEPLYEAETEKAAVVVESPASGTLVAWHFAVGDTAPIYAPLAEITEVSTASLPRISPRLRALAQRLQITETALMQWAQTSSEPLTESALESWQRAQQAPLQSFDEFSLPEHQRQLNRRAFGDSLSPVPATIKLPISWDAVQRAQRQLAQEHPSLVVSEFQVIAYAAAQATQEHPRLRSRLVGRETLRQYQHVTLGFAAKRGQDELTTAMVPEADMLSFGQLSQQINAAMRQVAKRTETPADESVTLLLSYMASYGVTDAVPVLTAPAVAMLFVGAPQNLPDGPTALLVLTFDHRILNGVGAALFLQAVAKQLEQLESGNE